MIERADQLVLDYVSKVADAAHGVLPPRRRIDFIAGLRRRIDAGRAGTDDPAAVARVLAGFGDPVELVGQELRRLGEEEAARSPEATPGRASAAGVSGHGPSAQVSPDQAFSAQASPDQASSGQASPAVAPGITASSTAGSASASAPPASASPASVVSVSPLPVPPPSMPSPSESPLAAPAPADPHDPADPRDLDAPRDPAGSRDPADPGEPREPGEPGGPRNSGGADAAGIPAPRRPVRGHPYAPMPSPDPTDSPDRAASTDSAGSAGRSSASDRQVGGEWEDAAEGDPPTEEIPPVRDRPRPDPLVPPVPDPLAPPAPDPLAPPAPDPLAPPVPDPLAPPVPDPPPAPDPLAPPVPDPLAPPAPPAPSVSDPLAPAVPGPETRRGPAGPDVEREPGETSGEGAAPGGQAGPPVKAPGKTSGKAFGSGPGGTVDRPGVPPGVARSMREAEERLARKRARGRPGLLRRSRPPRSREDIVPGTEDARTILLGHRRETAGMALLTLAGLLIPFPFAPIAIFTIPVLVWAVGALVVVACQAWTPSDKVIGIVSPMLSYTLGGGLVALVRAREDLGRVVEEFFTISGLMFLLGTAWGVFWLTYRLLNPVIQPGRGHRPPPSRT